MSEADPSTEFTREDLRTPVRLQENVVLGMGCGLVLVLLLSAVTLPIIIMTRREDDATVAVIVGIVYVAMCIYIMVLSYFSQRRRTYATIDPTKQSIIYSNGRQVPFSDIEEPFVYESQHNEPALDSPIQTTYTLFLNRRGRTLHLAGYGRSSLEDLGRLLVAMKKEAQRQAAEEAASFLADAPPHGLGALNSRREVNSAELSGGLPHEESRLDSRGDDGSST